MRRSPLASLAAALLVTAFAATAVTLPSSARAERVFLPRESEGPWLSSDKTLHFAASFAIAASCRVEGESEGTAAGVTIGIGVAKEVYDATFRPARPGVPRGASRRDLLMDLLGTAAGILFIRAIDR
ncbi:MAG TPA: hypothetical protein VFS09_05145 [Candidatus Eisenbacteria bacterium]|nr:hypothetical protein [Candidatus Eisenbacteria bacterium]